MAKKEEQPPVNTAPASVYSHCRELKRLHRLKVNLCKRIDTQEAKLDAIYKAEGYKR